MDTLERFRISLETREDIEKLHFIANELTDHTIMVESPDGCRINAKSLLGLIATKDFSSLYLVSDKPIYHMIKDFVI